MSLSEMVIVFTGFRDESLKAQIEAEGGKVSTTLVKDTTHLLVKKGAKPSKKLDEAKTHGIDALDLAEFIAEHNFHLSEKKPRAKKSKSDDEPSHEEPSHDEADEVDEAAEKPKKAEKPKAKKSKSSAIERIDAMIEELKKLKAELA